MSLNVSHLQASCDGKAEVSGETAEGYGEGTQLEVENEDTQVDLNLMSPAYKWTPFCIGIGQCSTALFDR